MGNEKRKRLRLNYTTQVLLTLKDTDETIDATLTDISMNGMHVNASKELPLDTKCDIKIILTGKGSTLTLEIPGLIARSGNDGLGIHFQNDMEWWPIFSMYHKGQDK